MLALRAWKASRALARLGARIFLGRFLALITSS
jgi:hypothetical protein